MEKARATAYENGAGSPRHGILSNGRWPWALGLFLLLGVFASLLVATAVFNFPVFAGGLGITLALLLPPTIFITALGLGYGTARVGELWSKVKWWHWLWLLAFCSALVWRVRANEAAEASPLDAWALLRVVPELVIAFALVVRLAMRRPAWLQSLFRGLVGALAIYSLACAASAMWSVYPTWTLYKSWEYLVDVSILAAVLATIDSTEDYHTLFNWTWLVYGLELLWVWVGIAFWPGEALAPPEGRTGGFALNGVFPITSANGVGGSGAVLAAIAFARLLSLTGRRSGRPWYVFLFLFGAASVVMSQTRSAVGGLLLGMVLIFFLSKRVKWGVLTALGSTVLLLLTGAGADIIEFLERGQTYQQLTGLTGRVGWWEFAWQELLKHPFTGLGAYAAGRFAVFQKLGLDTTTLHSDWIEVMSGTSFWGILPLLAALVGAWWLLIRFARSSAFSLFERQLAMEGVAVLAVITIRSFVNTELCWHAPLLFLVVVGYAEFLRRKLKYGAPPKQVRATERTDAPAPAIAS